MSLGLNTQVDEGSSYQDRKGIGDAHLYFPLREENEWEYEFDVRGEKKKQLVRVEGTETYRGLVWYHLTYTVIGEGEAFRRLLRTNGELLMQYNVARTEQIRLIDFGRQKADVSDLSLGFVENRDREITIAGLHFENCVVIGSGHIESEVGIYAPGIGLVESSWIYGRKQLTRAFIDGMEVGN